ncbi:MAG: LicD family protein [Myxococcales bacterium]|nr:MAG: LicD family protein [Myxococcales bacterium]
MKFFLITPIFLMITGCFPSSDLLPVFNLFSKQTPKEALVNCLAENPKLGEKGCDIKQCFASPITLVAMQDLLINTSEALNDLKINWWLDSGSAIAAYRFNAHLPWDDDVDLGVLASEINQNVLERIRKKLFQKGFEFRPLFGTSMMRNITGYQGIYQVAYRKNKFFSLLLSQNPEISPADLENYWLNYVEASAMMPHLDIFVFEEKGNGEWGYESDKFFKTQFKNQSMEKSILLPTKNINVLGKQFPIVNNINEYSKKSYQVDDIKNNFYFNRQHSKGCKAFSIKDIRKNPMMLEYIFEYLDFVYKTPAARALGIVYDGKKTMKEIYRN